MNVVRASHSGIMISCYNGVLPAFSNATPSTTRCVKAIENRSTICFCLPFLWDLALALALQCILIGIEYILFRHILPNRK